ncbi:MAG: large-conductance mechanosensitive channel protein MscL [Oscillibacter sp.]|nr:large-conductance mechanosensitive channel protein MscL [Oscillibacter sp.]
MKKFLKEFKEFASRGNVFDMAVGVILATAFGKITASLINDVLMPFIGWIFGGVDLSMLNIALRKATDTAPAVTIGIGTFLSAIINFILVAFVVFLLVKAMNKAMSLRAKKEESVDAPKAPTQEELLTEIRDLLKEQSK